MSDDRRDSTFYKISRAQEPFETLNDKRHTTQNLFMISLSHLPSVIQSHKKQAQKFGHSDGMY